MIRVERPVAPPILSSEAMRGASQEAMAWAKRVARPTKQAAVEHVFHPSEEVLGADVLEHLMQLFRSKCAFCEAPGDRKVLKVAWYRPPGSATDLDGASSAPHYAWLAYAWENLYLTCSRCDLARGRRFPCRRARGAVGAPVAHLASEEPVLLDPCGDDPDEHLVFDESGSVSGETERGRGSILMLDLNRTDLLPRRAAAVTEAIGQWRHRQLDAAMSESAPFAAARRQAIRRLVERAPEESLLLGYEAAIVETEDHVTIQGVELKKRAEPAERLARISQTKAQEAVESYSLEDDSTSQQYYAGGRFVERIEITNFRPIESLDIKLPMTTGEGPWTVMLGENGAGKSSVLQAVALALMGNRARGELGLDARRFVRRGTTKGEVKVSLTGVREPCALTFNKNEPAFGGTAEPKVLLLAYGATRLLPGRNAAPPSTGAIAEVDNLFDPFTPLADAAAWLSRLPDRQFTTAARGMRSLLGLTSNEYLRRATDGQVRARVLGATVTLDDLSDGYQSIVAFAADVMSVLFARWADLGAAEGVVILDELGSHLHPRWRMRIVERLRVLFPRVQFLVTTHDPLCLRGLRDGEVVVLERLEDAERTVVARTDLPPISGMRVDQLLTSELFGLRSTVDPVLEEAFDEYFALQARRELTPREEQRMAELAHQLEPLRVLGATPRERLVLEAADRFLAERGRTKPTLDPAMLHDDAVSALRDIWAEVEPERFDS